MTVAILLPLLLATTVHAQQQQEPWTKLVVVSGYPSTVYRDVEVIDLSPLSLTCTKPADFPGGEMASAGAFVDGRIMVCGGDTEAQYLVSCHTFDREGNAWLEEEEADLAMGRAWAAGVVIDESTWWLTGGFTPEPTDTTEVYSGGVWTAGAVLPVAQSDHCLLKLNETHAFLAGGLGLEAYLFHLEEEEWIRLPDMTGAPRLLPTCGVVDGGAEVVVAGGGNPLAGTDSSVIFSLTDLEWREGPDLPAKMEASLGIQFGDTFLAVGGHNDRMNVSYDAILMYDGDDEAWVELPQKLSKARGVYTAFLVPDEAVQCN